MGKKAQKSLSSIEEERRIERERERERVEESIVLSQTELNHSPAERNGNDASKLT